MTSGDLTQRGALDDRTLPSPPRRGPRQVGRYQILRELGQGGMGAVYLACDPRLEREVALKVVLPGASADAVRRVHVEARAVARLDHPGIVRLLDAEPDGHGGLLIALEVAAGGSLKDRIADGPLSCKEAATVMIPVCRAVQYAHDRDVLHRDLKPANVLLTADGTPKVSDFGLAKRQDEDQGLTKTGAVLGSPGYLAPEVAADEHQVDRRADVYGLGATLFALLTGRPPFQGSLYSVLTAVLTKPPPAPSAFNPEVDPALDAICLAALAPEPPDRTQSAEDLATALEAYLAGAAEAQPAPRPRWPLVALALAALVTAGLALRPPAPEPPAPASASPPAPAAAPPQPSSKATWVVDARTLAGTGLPGLEVWAPWCFRREPGGIRFRATPNVFPHLDLPVLLEGGPFRVTLSGRLRHLEAGTRLVLDLVQGAKRIGGVGLLPGAYRRDIGWRGFTFGTGPNGTKGDTVAPRTREAPVWLRLEYAAGALTCSAGSGPATWCRETLPPQRLREGIYRLRVAGRVLPRSERPHFAFETPEPEDKPGNLVDVGALRLEATGLTPVPPPPGAGAARELGLLGRAVAAGRAEPTIARLTRATQAEGWTPSQRDLARYLLAQLLAVRDPARAANLLDPALHRMDSRFPILSTLHVRWSLNLFNATDAWVDVLGRAYMVRWGLHQGDVPARTKVLARPPSPELLLSGLAAPDPQRRAVAQKRYRLTETYLFHYLQAERALLQGRGALDDVNEATAWFMVGALDRARGCLQRLFDARGSGARARTMARHLLGMIAFRRCLWAEAIRWLEKLPQAQREGRRLGGYLAEARRRIAEERAR